MNKRTYSQKTFDCQVTEDLKKMEVPILFLHGDDDRIVPIADSGMPAVKLVKNGKLKVYKGAMWQTCAFNLTCANYSIRVSWSRSRMMLRLPPDIPNGGYPELDGTELRSQSSSRPTIALRRKFQFGSA